MGSEMCIRDRLYVGNSRQILSHIAWLKSRNMLIDRDWRAAVETCVFVGGVRREVGCKENAACAILPGTGSLWLDQ